ncbi:MAG: hypothetical protein BAA04_01615 [Firmicutes bacterium ZCTH02-B6]|nr:MAG: hypothetical protein BAA04_01615 [Firmicutes bacterium ZCTH02-B6]
MNRISIGLGEYRVGRAVDEEWTIYGLGSCVGLILCDPGRRVSAMAHVVLPEHHAASADEPAKFGDTVVPFLLHEMSRLGARREAIYAQLAGGARMLSFSELPDIGARNVAVVREQLALHGVPIVAERVGGTHGRTLSWDVRHGVATVKRVGAPAEVLTPQDYVFEEVAVVWRSYS